MSRVKRNIRFFLAAVGCLMICAGLVAAYWWEYKLAPIRRLADPEWLAKHSEAARWAEEQKDYHRMGNSPDLFFRGDKIGFYGDKKLFLWLEGKIRASDSFRHCGCTEDALTFMANRKVDSWARWTDANRERSQEEWIQDGFVSFGIKVHLPPEPDDTLPLLRFLGRKGWNSPSTSPQDTNSATAAPAFVQYNAYRWLRDSGFSFPKFVSSNEVLLAEPEIVAGLLKFAQWRAAYPGNPGLGVLVLKEQDAPGTDLDLRPPIVRPFAVFGVYAVIAVLIFGGGFLIRRFGRSQKNILPTKSSDRFNTQHPKRPL